MVVATNPKLAGDQQADICLILEGTYPFIRGGVSSWVHQIITGLPELTFALLFIGDKSSNYSEIRYSLPTNVVDLTAIFLLNDGAPPKAKACPGNKDAFERVKRMHNEFLKPELGSLMEFFPDLMRDLFESKTLDYDSFLHSHAAWDFITEEYQQRAENESFLDYFWTIRSMHGPLFSLISQVSKAPKARVYHSISTGYAGFFGMLLHKIHQRSFILTEHGIYTKERKIDLAQIEWIHEENSIYGPSLDKNFGYLRKLWIHFFETLGRLAYASAQPVIAITEGNRHRQIIDGADSKNVIVIPNGVDLKKYYALRERPARPPLIVGFIGRVVPIKDVKTFFRAMRTVYTQLPEVQAWIIGGEDEDPKYAQECRDLVTSLNLQSCVVYKGFYDIKEIIGQVGLIVLSSISEGLPLVILEAYASGLPVVATDVGSCRELIEGGSTEDKQLGTSGAVVPIANAEALSTEIIRYLSHAELWEQSRQVAMQRVDRFFNEENLFINYRNVYQNALNRLWPE